MAAQQESHPQSGSFYMINHFKIQPWMLEHLKHVRVVKVVEDPTDTTVVAAEYASVVSVESYFGVRGNSSTMQDEFEMIDPEILDIKEDGFPTRALYRRISHQEFSDRKYSADFWIIPPCYVEPPIHVGSYYTIDRTALPPVSFHSVDELRTAKVVKVLEMTDSTVWIGYSNEQSVNQFLKLYQIAKSIPDLMGNPVINRRQEVLVTTAERLLDERLRPNWVERRGDRTFWVVEDEDYGLSFGSPFGSPQRVIADQPPPPVGAPDLKWIPGRFYRIDYAKLPEGLISLFKQTAIVIVHDADRRMVRVRFPDAETVKKYLDASPRPELPTLRHLVSLPQNVAERFVEEVGEDEVRAMKGSREFWLSSKWIPGRFYRLNYAELPEGLISLFKKTAIIMVHDADVQDAGKCKMVRMRFPDAEAVNKYLDAYPRAELPTLKHLVCLPQSEVERFVEEIGDDEVETRKGSREFWLGVEVPLEEDEGVARGGGSGGHGSGGQGRGGARRGWSHSLGLQNRS